MNPLESLIYNGTKEEIRHEFLAGDIKPDWKCIDEDSEPPYYLYFSRIPGYTDGDGYDLQTKTAFPSKDGFGLAFSHMLLSLIHDMGETKKSFRDEHGRTYKECVEQLNAGTHMWQLWQY